jgi:lipopolysaccharide transport system permease protein
MNESSRPRFQGSSQAEQGFAIDLRHGIGFVERNRMAWDDLARGLSLWRLAWTLSVLDIRLRYRGSILGPFWLTLSTALMVGSLGFVYAYLFHIPIHDYLPFLALSLVLWGFLSSVISEASACFITSEGMIRAMRMPFSLYIGQLMSRNVLVLAHNIVVIAVVFVAFHVSISISALAAIPAFLVWLLDGAAISLILGSLCARFRDIPPIVGSIVQIAFYVSAVLWKPDLLGKGKGFLLYDPFYTIFEIVRAPLLGGLPSTATYVSATVFSVVLCGLSWLTFLRVRHRIAFWV